MPETMAPDNQDYADKAKAAISSMPKNEVGVVIPNEDAFDAMNKEAAQRDTADPSLPATRDTMT